MGKPHKHAALIKAWADGAEIQVSAGDGGWFDTKNPLWEDEHEYRIKPVPKVKEYRYVYKLANNSPCLTTAHYATAHDLEEHMRTHKQHLEWCERVHQTMIES